MEKIRKKTKNQKKPAGKPAAKRISAGKNKKKSEAMRVFLLTGTIILVSVIVSCAVITAHSVSKKNQNNGGVLTSVSVNENDQYIKPDNDLLSQLTIESENKNAQDQIPRASDDAHKKTQDNQTVSPPSAQPAVNEEKPSVKPAYKGTLIFVIDDAGNNLRELDAFLNIPGPLTIAVLPGLSYSAEAAKRIRAAGKEVILHQPMEAIGAQNPGPGAIYSGMSAGEIREILSRNIAEVGPVAGINNHQGSKITMDLNAMETILAFCKENNIYFLDSRTTAETAAPAAAQKLGMKIAERNIFLDNEQSRDSMQYYLSAGLARAQTGGTAVMIGHTWSPELAPLLAQQFPLLLEQGYIIKTVSDIIR